MLSSQTRNNPKKRGRALLPVALAALILGMSLLGIKAMNTAAHNWKPVQLTLPAEPGQRAITTFVAELDQYYEIVLEFDSILPEVQLRKLLEEVREPPSVDVAWWVAQDGKDLAAGNSGAILYTSSGGRSILGQLRRRVMSEPFHRGRGSFVQIIGRMRGEAGRSYQVTVEHRSLDPALDATSPRLGLQLSREFWMTHSQGMLAFAYAGLLLMGISGMFFLLWTGVALLRKRKAVSK